MWVGRKTTTCVLGRFISSLSGGAAGPSSAWRLDDVNAAMARAAIEARLDFIFILTELNTPPPFRPFKNLYQQVQTGVFEGSPPSLVSTVGRGILQKEATRSNGT